MYLLYKTSLTEVRFLIYLENDHDFEQYQKNNYLYVLMRIDDCCGKFIESFMKPIIYDRPDIPRRVCRLHSLYVKDSL